MEREDYFFGEQISVNRSKVYALVIYDIVDNSKRTKLHKLLNGYGTSIQKSGFEICVSPHKFEKLLNQIPAFCGREDSIRIYRITGKNLVYKWGIDNSNSQEDVIII